MSKNICYSDAIQLIKKLMNNTINICIVTLDRPKQCPHSFNGNRDYYITGTTIYCETNYRFKLKSLILKINVCDSNPAKIMGVDANFEDRLSFSMRRQPSCDAEKLINDTIYRLKLLRTSSTNYKIYSDLKQYNISLLHGFIINEQANLLYMFENDISTTIHNYVRIDALLHVLQCYITTNLKITNTLSYEYFTTNSDELILNNCINELQNILTQVNSIC